MAADRHVDHWCAEQLPLAGRDIVTDGHHQLVPRAEGANEVMDERDGRGARRVDSTGHHQRDPHRRAVWPTQPRYPPRITSTLRHRQLQLLQAVLARLRDEPAVLPAWSLAEVQLTGLASGLTALAGELGLFDPSADDVTEYVRKQRAQVAQRVDRFRALAPAVLGVLNDAAIPLSR